jgi:hypothetical protein
MLLILARIPPQQAERDQIMSGALENWLQTGGCRLAPHGK